MKRQTRNNSPDVQPNERITRKRKFKKRYTWLKFILSFILLSAAIIALAISPVFNITRIVVTGNKHDREEAIAAATGIIIGNNAFKSMGRNAGDIVTLQYSDAESRILKKFPYVKHVSVRFALPDRISVRIEERTAMALVSYMGAYLLIDDAGYVMEVSKDSGQYKLPLIEGLKFERYELGQALKIQDTRSFEVIDDLFRKIKKLDEQTSFKLYAVLNKVNVSDLNNIRLTVNSKLEVNLGNLDELEYRINYLKTTCLNYFKSTDQGVLDFTVGDRPVFKPDKQ